MAVAGAGQGAVLEGARGARPEKGMGREIARESKDRGDVGGAMKRSGRRAWCGPERRGAWL
jgi:hypothetical protein